MDEEGLAAARDVEAAARDLHRDGWSGPKLVDHLGLLTRVGDLARGVDVDLCRSKASAKRLRHFKESLVAVELACASYGLEPGMGVDQVEALVKSDAEPVPERSMN